MRIAIIGTRGVPPRYGGFETFAAELGRRLVARGHDVTVYARSYLYPERPETWEGIRLVHLPAVRHKYFETVSHAFLSSVHAAGARYDVALLCNAANAFVLPILRAAGIPTATNVDGIERMRKKWNVLGKLVYLGGEALSATFSTRLVADAETIAAYYRRRLGARPDVIAYGADFPEEEDGDILERLGLTSGRYVLYVSRFEPENHPVEVAAAYGRVETDLPLVMVGSAPYAGELIEALRGTADERTILPGAIFGRDYRTLQRQAALYVQATEVGGTHPALIEAMGSNGVVLALDTPENREVGGDAVRYFRFDGAPRLEQVLSDALAADPGPWRRRARERVAAKYRWDAITDAYEHVFEEMTGGA
ncbi:MAG: glycosyltransferase [Thermoanaerobaculia bacterium]